MKKSFTKSGEDLRNLPGFDVDMHNSDVVDEIVEEKDGRKFITYRTKKEITDEALRNFDMPFFKRW